MLPQSSTALAAAALTGLIGALVAAGFLLFPGCSGRCCPPPCARPEAPMPVPTGMPAPPATVEAAPVAVAAPPAAPGKAPGPTAHEPPADLPEADRAAFHAIHNYFRMSRNLASGAQPEGEADFAALAAAGIKSILSVDGATPDVAAATKYGLRYVHMPIGYDGISTARGLELAKAFDTLAKDGPIFVHCHHGKHRGPAAASIGRMVVDGTSPEACVAWMKQAGTDPKYRGLYASVAAFARPSAEALAAVEVALVEKAATPPLQQQMVAIDQTWDRIKAIRAAAWGSPADHPDVDPPHEARILAEHFRELARQPELAKEGDAFQRHLAASEEAAWALEKALTKGALDAGGAQRAFDASVASCTACHQAFRDSVHRR